MATPAKKKTQGGNQKGKKRKADDTKVNEKVLKAKTSEIKNKMKRQEVYGKQKTEKKKLKKQLKLKRKKEAEELGIEVPKQVPRTLDNTREHDVTTVTPDNEEVKIAESIDEFAKYFDGSVKPKICITTGYKFSKVMFEFIRNLLDVFPNSFFYERKKFPLKDIIEEAVPKGFTDIVVINEDRKELNAITIVHLPDGPTARFKLTNVMPCSEVPNRCEPTNHRPEVILNKFSTRLGVRVGRMLGALFHQEPNFKGRRVVTFHNQRDFLFFRHHRYIFDNPKKARLQEIGPRFTLKLQWLQHGTFDTEQGKFEWIHRRELDTSRRRFFL